MMTLLRARLVLEADRTRTVEHSDFQLQALVDQMPTADAPLSERPHATPSQILQKKRILQMILCEDNQFALDTFFLALEILKESKDKEEIKGCFNRGNKIEESFQAEKDQRFASLVQQFESEASKLPLEQASLRFEFLKGLVKDVGNMFHGICDLLSQGKQWESADVSNAVVHWEKLDTLFYNVSLTSIDFIKRHIAGEDSAKLDDLTHARNEQGEYRREHSQ
jgi:hypothetical protein